MARPKVDASFTAFHGARIDGNGGGTRGVRTPKMVRVEVEIICKITRRYGLLCVN